MCSRTHLPSKVTQLWWKHVYIIQAIASLTYAFHYVFSVQNIVAQACIANDMTSERRVHWKSYILCNNTLTFSNASASSLRSVFLKVQCVHDDVCLCSVIFSEQEVLKFAFVSVLMFLQIMQYSNMLAPFEPANHGALQDPPCRSLPSSTDQPRIALQCCLYLMQTCCYWQAL